MCSGTRKQSPPPSPSTSNTTMEGDPEKLSSSLPDALLLLEFSACDDLEAFKKAVEIDGLNINAAASWYGRSLGTPRRMGFELRTPLMIAAAYGSVSVLEYILSSKSVDVNQRCGSDGATALHCVAAGGSAAAVEVSKLLIEASADIDAVDYSGNRPADLIPRQVSGFTTKSLEVLLKASNSSRPLSPMTVKEKESDSPTKKEYPPDLTLPDIKNGIYSTDEFRMYAFKIKPCSRAYSHDWTECPFVHPGENARRRDPRKYSYSCVPCPEFRKGSCRNGDACEYAHGVFESWLHPAQYRTRLCKDETGCNRRVCFFAHKPEELRSVNPSSVSTALGASISSPRSPSINGTNMPSIDMATALLMMQQPGSPSAAASSASAWMNQPSNLMSPTSSLQLPSSRLKSNLSARGMDLSIELLARDGYQQRLNDITATAAGSASPRSVWVNNSLSAAAAAAAASRASGYNDLLGSIDPSVLAQLHTPASRGLDYGDLMNSLDASMLPQLQGLSMKPKTGVATSAGQFSSPTGIQKQQSLNQQILSGYGTTSMAPSSPVTATSSMGLDQSSFAKAIMYSRASAFAKRSQSFIDRGAGAINRQQGLSVSPPPLTATSAMSNWALPSGKLDWGVEGDELNNLRKSTSFNNRTNSTAGLAPVTMTVHQQPDEPDLSWVHSLVKEPGPGPVGRMSPDYQQQLKQRSYTEQQEQMLQMYMEQEQMVA